MQVTIAPETRRRLTMTSFKAGAFDEPAFEAALCKFLDLDVDGGEFISVQSATPNAEYDTNNVVSIVLKLGTNYPDRATDAQSKLTSSEMMGELDSALAAAGLPYAVHAMAKIMVDPSPSPVATSSGGGGGGGGGGGNSGGGGVPSGASSVEVDSSGPPTTIIIAVVVAVVVVALAAVGAFFVRRHFKARNAAASVGTAHKPSSVPGFFGGTASTSEVRVNPPSNAARGRGGTAELDGVVVR
jgi:hypothetical protein